MIRSSVRVLGVVSAIAVVFGGCAGTHLYRKSDHDLALKAQASFADAKLTEMTKEEGKRLDEMLQAELKASRRQILATRDADLLAIVGETQDAWPKLADAIAARIDRVLGTGHVATMVGAYNDADEARKLLPRIADAYRAMRSTSDPGVSCPPPAELPQVSAAGKAQFDQYRAACRRYLEAREKLAKAGAAGSLWMQLNARIATAEDSKAAYEAELKSVQAAYETEKKAYDAAVKRGQADQLTGLAGRVRAALDTIAKPLTSENAKAAEKKLASVGLEDLNLQGLVQALDERRRALTDLLGPVPATKSPPATGGAEATPPAAPAAASPSPAPAGGAPATATPEATATAKAEATPAAPAGTPLARAIAASLPSIDLFLAKGQAPPTTALVLEAENLRLQSEGLKKRIAGADAQMALLLAERDAMRGEIVWLAKAGRSVAAVRQACTVSGDLAADLKSFSPSCREDGLRALVFYANSWNLGRVVEDQIRYTRLAASHRSVLDASDTALAQWQNLIAVPVSQLVAYHGSGIKPEDIVALLQALSVAGIAAGVNR